MTDTRRPLNSRDTGWARRTARWLSRTSLTPNRISQGSILFAALACLAFWASAHTGTTAAIVLLLLAALGCQLRLLCNLFDGMVAVEGGKSEPDGPFWNEAPDRAADLLILTGAGLATGQLALGLLGGALAIATAYIRELGRAEGLGSDFSGPFAKPQRMAAITAGAVLSAIELGLFETRHALLVALIVTALGTGFTALARSARLIRALKHRARDMSDT
ncbi:CDP-alcohol phosphatidyltransferase [Roseovarius sp. THAF8]|uniref:CDP-alcohol phosphatidyltransferase family protein n=1 Tax=Roseovarius sp. THAF8 TaxID=2587846 RepID=UPI0012684203|nr:CDP-alcohol phosphatidyltransferase family protein [Roseovarius sp. THAF8]QFT98497.1 CDP-alcohol phosphatidyltransferase [Roseovarius sp. THAF8]